MKVAIYDVVTGMIKRIVSCPTELVELQAQSNEEFYLNCPESATHIINNEPVTVAPPPPTLDEVKADKLTQIAQCFGFLLIGSARSYTTTGLSQNITVNARERDLANAEKLRDKMEDEALATLPFRCFDNSFVELTLEDVKQLIRELRDYGFSLYRKKWNLEAQVNAATTVEEVGAITWQSGDISMRT